MPVLMDPETALPEKKRKMSPSQLIMLLLYPVIFVVGLSVGLVIGLRQGNANASNTNQNQNANSATIIPNANNVVNTNTTNANVNGILNNSNSALNGGDFLEIDAETQATLDQQEQQEKSTKVDQSTSLTDIVRQQDLITLKYSLKAYEIVNEKFPNTLGEQIRLDRSSKDTLYQALKEFYGGSYNEPIDPEHPTYYYGYTSDGKTFELTTYLVSQNKVFIVTN